MTTWIARYGQVLVALLIAIVGIAAGAFAGRYASRGMQKKFSPQAATLTSKALKYGIIAFALLMTLNHLGIRLPALLGAAGIAGVAIGFAAQTSLSNLISGIFLVLERPYAVGDLIRVGSDTGIVHSIDLLSLKLRTFDNLLIRIPNETVIKSSVTNITAFGIRRIDIELGVAYKEDIEHVLRVLARVVDANPLCLDEPEPLIMFKGFGDEPDHPGRQVYKHHHVDKGEQYEFEPPDPKHGEYVTGADWAKEKDWTVIATFRVDVSPWRLVAYSRTNRKPYPFMVKLFNDRMNRYPGHGIHDGTGLGNVVNDYLDSRATPFIMSGRARDDMLSEFVSAVENGKVVAPKVESAYTEHKYCSLEDLYARGKDFHLPDTVCAFALAWHKRNRRTRSARPILDVAYEDGSPWKAVG